MAFPPKTPWGVALILLLPLAMLTVTYLLPNPAYIRDPLLGCEPASASAAGKRPELSLLIGIHTIATKYARRHLLRMAYALQAGDVDRNVARVEIKFVLCRPADEQQRVMIALEVLQHGDIMILDCVENAEGGKTYTYFSSLPAMVEPYDYVMKLDDDAYVRLGRLVESLRRQPKVDMYYGCGLPFQDRKSPPFMLGMGYAVSWDLVEWIASSEMVRREAAGVEDTTLGKWLNMGEKAKNRVNVFPRMYDYRGPNAGDFLDDTILVHQLKKDVDFVRTLIHFNATAGVDRLPKMLPHSP